MFTITYFFSDKTIEVTCEYKSYHHRQQVFLPISSHPLSLQATFHSPAYYQQHVLSQEQVYQKTQEDFSMCRNLNHGLPICKECGQHRVSQCYGVKYFLSKARSNSSYIIITKDFSTICYHMLSYVITGTSLLTWTYNSQTRWDND